MTQRRLFLVRFRLWIILQAVFANPGTGLQGNRCHSREFLFGVGSRFLVRTVFVLVRILDRSGEKCTGVVFSVALEDRRGHTAFTEGN